MQLTFLGTGAGGGVPSFFCGCAACQEAAANPRDRRSRCGLLLHGAANTLVDAPPELRLQLIQNGIHTIDSLILTHTHYDHVGGLGDLEFFIRLARGQALPAYLTPESLAGVQTSFGFLQDCLFPQVVEPGWQWELDGAVYTGLEVTHAPGTLGLLVETGGRRTAYLPDTGPLPEATRAQVLGVDTLILGASFWGRNWMPADHLSVEEAVQIAQQARPGRLFLTHLSMHYDRPVTHAELESYLNSFDPRFQLAYDGLQIEI